ncbi:GMC family oxidoreductase [Saccharothrix obliqua]|uniref:GMC family oxidoreductase n=1 Tax=Saccharothrix obliqua TaxID=2861747 RepID=UPI001C5D6654|nr:GMC family oxidoreductase N-terminal domain-containing protein [Saccharothrix obliqua]MBW4722344.1 GMC family oxidoreductase N-terminal domain-containing protein [Saccharothrix obliqua]
MTRFDYVIVGAGPAGCVLANRLSADRAVEVLLIEAGGPDTNPLITMPGGFPALLSDPDTAWHYRTRPFGPARQVEHWVRGRTLGGSTSINGMIYNRGGGPDYDALADLGNPGWGWADMLPVFKEIEDNQLGVSDVRGEGGPLHVSTTDRTEPLLEDVLAAGVELGWERARDLNETDGERIGYAMATIRGGERVSAATAFLRPVLDRPNLTVVVDTTVDRVVVEGGRAVGVRGRRDGHAVEYRAAREVVLAAGSIATPRVLQLSGIGPAATLRAAGVEVVVESPNVGNRMREHRMFRSQFRLTEDVGYNRLLGTEDGRRAAEEMYHADRRGPLAAPSFDIIGFFKTRPELSRPDAQFQVAPFSMRLPEPGKFPEVERAPGMWCIAYALHPDSEGSVHITSADPDAPLAIDPNYYATESDRAAAVAVFRGVRRLFATEALSRWIDHEVVPGPEVRTDREIVEHGMAEGLCGYHAIGTCAMGPRDDDVVDSRLRVRGLAGLRVVDASVLPTMLSGNPTGPVTALAWRAADLIAAEA